MKNILIILILLSFLSFDSRKENAFDVGESLKFRIHYGFVTAGYATLEVQDATVNNKKVFHVVGKGYTTGVSKMFFKVEDTYESYIDKVSGSSYRYVRKINEGGYTKNQEGFFNLSENKVLVKDYKHKSEKTFTVPQNTQDILSSFYYLRNYPNIDKLKAGESVYIDLFFDNETTKFRLKFIEREDITTKFGVVSTMVFRPYVQSGRIFKEQESLTIWISSDQNKVPLRIKANLVVGAIKADLDSFKGLQGPLVVKKK